MAVYEESPSLKRGLLLEASKQTVEDIELLLNTSADSLIEPLPGNLAAAYMTLGMAKFELAKMSADTVESSRFLSEALEALRKTCDALREYIRFVGVPDKGELQASGKSYEEYGKVLRESYSLSKDNSIILSFIDATERAAEYYADGNALSRAAECHWRIAEVTDNLGDFPRASKAFERASHFYRILCESLPKFRDFYDDYGDYMSAWAQIEEAKLSHAREDYKKAALHYSSAATILDATRTWSYLKPNFEALATVEQAESLSREERSEEAEKTFTQARGFFGKAEDGIRTGSDKLRTAEERQKISKLAEAIPIRKEYCGARAVLEQARNADRKGDQASAVESYSSSSATFSEIAAKLERDHDRLEMERIAYLSKAWAKMADAESKLLPELYAEAAELFGRVKEMSGTEKLGRLAAGNSYFCQALQAAASFKSTGRLDKYSEAKLRLDNAAELYSEAGFENEARWAKATQRLLDAYVYMDSAHKTPDPDKRSKYCAMSEKVLGLAAGLYEDAGFLGKRDEALRALRSVKEEKELALSLNEILTAPSLVTSTANFPPPTPSRESPVGLERFDQADVQSSLIMGRREVTVGEDLFVELELVNAGRGPALIMKVERAVPEGFDVVSKPENYRFSQGSLDLKGRRLDPMSTMEVKLQLRARDKGTFSFEPAIVFVDDRGRRGLQEPEPVTMTVKELGIAGWLKGRSKRS